MKKAILVVFMAVMSFSINSCGDTTKNKTTIEKSQSDRDFSNEEMRNEMEIPRDSMNDSTENMDEQMNNN